MRTMSATVSSGSPSQIGSPALLYQREAWSMRDIAPDGKTLVFIERLREGEPLSLVVTLHAVTPR
jgi:hypothetical protein